MTRPWAGLAIISVTAVLGMTLMLAASAQTASDHQDKGFDVNLHLGNDGSPREAGLPVYPGARLRKDDNKDNNSANLSLFTQTFGWKLVVVNYDSDDSPSKVIAYYHEKLKKYGKVLECHINEHGGDVSVHQDNDDSKKTKELKCEGDNTGNVVELKVGTEDNQHVVAIQAAEKGKGSTFSLIYLYSRGKQADI